MKAPRSPHGQQGESLRLNVPRSRSPRFQPAGLSVLLLALAFWLAFPAHGKASENEEAEEATLTDEENPAISLFKEYFPEDSSFKDWIAGLKSQRRPKDPPPPQLPRKFRWSGRYVVADLIDPATGKQGIVVPFVWFGQDGNTQMIAGGPKYPIYFTNYIYKDHLYTYTYKWPQLQRRFLPPRASCAAVFALSIDDFNAFLATSQYVGPEILQEKTPRSVHHFRATVVVPTRPPGARIRFALAQADIYVEKGDSTKFRQMLHFGYQNLYDPALDEWIIIDKFERGGGEIIFPPCCPPP